MKQLLDYLPAIVFFAVYFSTGRDIMLATWSIIIACTVQITLSWLLWRKVDKIHWVVFGVTLVFGGATLFFQNDTFIKWRPTVINGLLASILLVGHFLHRNFLQRLVDTLTRSTLHFTLSLKRADWQRLNLYFILYFIAIGLLNLYVAYNFSTDFWVSFKLIGFTLLQLLFYGFVFWFLYKNLPESDRQRLLGKDSADKEDK